MPTAFDRMKWNFDLFFSCTMEYNSEGGYYVDCLDGGSGGNEYSGIMSSSISSLPDENDPARSDVAVYSLWDVLSASTSLPSLVDEHQLL